MVVVDRGVAEKKEALEQHHGILHRTPATYKHDNALEDIMNMTF